MDTWQGVRRVCAIKMIALNLTSSMERARDVAQVADKLWLPILFPSLPLSHTPLPDKWMFALAFGTSCVHFVLTVARHASACTHTPTNTLAYAWAGIDASVCVCVCWPSRVKEPIAGSTKFCLVRHLESPVAYWTQLFNSAQHATPQIRRHATSTFHGNQFEC